MIVSTRQQKEVARLREQLQRAVHRAATADDDLLAEYQMVAKKIRLELTETESRLRLSKRVDAQGGPALWAAWWRDIRPGLLLAADDPEVQEDVSDT